MIRLLLHRLIRGIKDFIRRVYWSINLGRALEHPASKVGRQIVCEGKGTLTIGANATLHDHCELSVGAQGSLHIESSAQIREQAIIRVGHGTHVRIGSSFLLERGSRLFIQKDWRIGDDVKIATDCALFSRESPQAGKLSIGDGTHIGDHTIIDVADDVTIGREVALGPNCVIYSHDHDYQNADGAAWKGPLVTAPVNIGDGAWVGSGVTILPGVTIGERAVIAAGAVVTKNVPSGGVWGGIPAKSLV
jgi:acetyltransferase-like isoleucine patch superfamily enzyme